MRRYYEDEARSVFAEGRTAKSPNKNLVFLLVLIVLAAVGCQISTASAQIIQPIYSFPVDGESPEAALTLGPDGNFYGTTQQGGSSGDGAVFQVTTNGTLTTLASFDGANGAGPEAALSLGPDGNFYGTTQQGGSRGYGTIFRVTTNGVLTTLISFADANGANPDAALTLGPDNNFYGTTEAGGGSGNGTVFQVTTNGVLTTLHSFSALNGSNENSDGANPYAGLTLGPDGNFYGTTQQGGSSGDGTVFQVTTNGVLTTLYSFSALNGQSENSDGANPQAALTLGPDGNFYGTTFGGGSNGYGTVFQVTTNGGLTTLVSFDDANGANPQAALTLGPDGNFYGTTVSFGGTVFHVTTNGVLTTLVSFDSANGLGPDAALTLGPDGNFYGTTADLGGTVFQVSTNGALTTLVRFANPGAGNGDGINPSTPNVLTLGPDGNFYGTTQDGGSFANGSVFRVTTNGVLTTIYSFTGGNDQGNPRGALALGPDGNFYGTTEGNDGTVFRVTINGVLTTLVSFAGTNGNAPAALTLGPDGNFYGTTFEGGGSGDGTVFQVTANGVLTTLYSFTGGKDGGNPNAGLTLGPDGNFYGTTFEDGSFGKGTVFQVTTSGTLATLVSFANTNGANPDAGLTLGPDGNFYGTTFGGGSSGDGIVFRVTTNGVLTTLDSFTGGNDGSHPNAALTLGSDGNFYGVSDNGGSFGAGIVFQVTTNGVLTTLYSFSAVNGSNENSDGANPYDALTLGPDGNFYGTTQDGGAEGGGVIYRLNISPPNIISEPVSVTLPIGDTAHFEVSATGGLYYQWFFNTNTASADATNASLAVGPAITNYDGYYQVIVSNFFGCTTSTVASLTVLVEPNMAGISNNPAGGTATVSMGSYPGSTNYLYATTNLALPLSQWQLIATNVAASDGLFQFVDTNANVPVKFYRIVAY